MFYLDTSVIVAMLLQEPASGNIRLWFADRLPAGLMISEWVITEFSSALALKVRTADIDVAQRAAALTEFGRLIDEDVEILGIERSHFRSAAAYVDQTDLGLRSGDALHLAVAVGAGLTVVTLDQRLAKAGSALGISTELLP